MESATSVPPTGYTPETVVKYSTPLPPHYLEQIPGAVCAVVGIAASLLFVRFFVNKYILIPISVKYLPLPNEVKTGERPLNNKEKQCIMKLCKYFWHGFVYFAMTVLNVYIIATHDWALDIRGWTKVPTFDDDVSLAKWFFWIQTGWYLHSLIESLWVDAFRADFVVMLVHHLLAGMLVWGAWVGGNHRVGILITFEQDLSDIVLYSAKVYDKFKSDVYTGRALPGSEKGHTIGLLVVAIAWIILRYGILGYILYAIYTYVRLYEWWRKVLFCFLISIWFMQIMWGIGLFKMVYDQLTKGEFHDIFHDTRDAKKKAMQPITEGDKDEHDKDELEKKKE